MKTLISLATPASLSLASLLFASPASAQGTVWVVDDDGGVGVDFTEVQAAVDAASDGDTILVKDGSYADLQVTNKDLVLVAEVGGTPTVPSVTVSNLLDVRTLVLRGFETNELRVEQCAGPVWIEDHTGSGGDPACTITDSEDVVLVNSFFSGAGGFYGGGLFGPPTTVFPTQGMSLSNSIAHLYDVFIGGGNGGGGNEGNKGGQSGARAMSASSSTLYLSGSTCFGGSGGAGYSAILFDPFGFDTCGTGGFGGTGAYLSGTTELVHRDSTFVGGIGGLGGQVIQVLTVISECSDGLDGTGLFVGGTATEEAIPRAHRSFGINSPARVGEQLTLEFDGEPGDLAFLFLSTGTAPLVNLPCGGSILFDLGSFVSVATVPMDAAGQATLNVPAPGIGASSALDFFLQANFVDLNGECNVSTGSVAVLLDPGL